MEPSHSLSRSSSNHPPSTSSNPQQVSNGRKIDPFSDRQTSTVPMEPMQTHPQGQQADQTPAKSSRKKLVRVASQQKEVSGEEYLEMLMVEREDLLKKSLDKQRGEKIKLEEDHPKSIERKSRRFLDSDEEEEKKEPNMPNIPNIGQTKNDSAKRQGRGDYPGEEEKKEELGDIVMGKNDGLSDSQKSKSSLVLGKKSVSGELKGQEKIIGELISPPRSEEKKADLPEDKMKLEPEVRSKEEPPKDNIIENITEESYLDTSKFGSKKKSKGESGTKETSSDTQKDLERKSLELKSLESPSLSRFLEQATPESKTITDHEKIQKHPEESPKRGSETKMRLEPQGEVVSKSPQKKSPSSDKIKEEPIVDQTQSHIDDSKSGPKKKSGKSKSPKQKKKKPSNEKYEIIVSPPQEDTSSPGKIKEEQMPKSPEKLHKSSLKPSSFTKDQEKNVVRDSKRKTAVKFAEMVEISSSKNALVYEEAEEPQGPVTRSKRKDFTKKEEKHLDEPEKEGKRRKKSRVRKHSPKLQPEDNEKDSSQEKEKEKEKEKGKKKHAAMKTGKSNDKPIHTEEKRKTAAKKLKEEDGNKTEDVAKGKTREMEEKATNTEPSKGRKNEKAVTEHRVTRGMERNDGVAHHLRSRGKEHSKEELVVKKKVKK